MPQRLSYADAVRILGGPGPFGKAVDNLLGGALSVATAGGSDLAISLFDAKTEMVKLSGLVTAKINDSVRGLGRHDRSERLQAAHVVLVVTAFFEALDTCLTASGVANPDFTRDDQLAFAAHRDDGPLVQRLLETPVPLPAPDVPYAGLLSHLESWFTDAAARMKTHLTGFATWDDADEQARRALTTLLDQRLPAAAVHRYDETHRRLSEEIPEFALWADRLEARATTRGLERLESLLVQATSGRDPSRHRAALARAYRAELDRPVLGGDAGELLLPALGAVYLDPIFRVRAAGPGARPADDHWWTDAETRTDLAGFLAAYLTTTQATEAPLLLLGQPGAGKSSLTRILSARLPAADFFVCRIALRDVQAEAEIQDQIELALRTSIGETVSWARLAEEAGGALPVVLLDGFDELLQATGLHQSDYLQRVARFQQREAALGRPVAVMVTSRVAVADRARVPAGALAVRLEPFDDAQIERWLTVWNATNPRLRPLSLDALPRLRHLAEQPLLLLMLALYDATGNALQDGATLDGGQLYERLLASFAAREVRRIHAGQPDSAIPALVEQELLRLSVVAFAMFHRLRLWVTERELDADLAGLGLTPTRPGSTDGFRTPLTAGQEMVGRFFFIQRSQALRDDQTLQTYEFLHATFGEYLVARLVVQAVRDTEAREAAGTLALRLGPAADDDLLRSLLGFTPLSARATILPFVVDLLADADRDRLRAWLTGRTSQAVTRPTYVESHYRPVDKRIDHWMATYSFNLLLLTLACGGEVRASDLFTETDNPARWLRGSALQWQAAVPGEMWMDAMEIVTVNRVWHNGKRDVVLTHAHPWTGEGPDPMDVSWLNDFPPGRDPAPVYRSKFELPAALKSMHLSNALSDDALLHAVEPLLQRMPGALSTFVLQSSGADESMVRSLVELWVTSAFEESAEARIACYKRVTTTITTLWTHYVNLDQANDATILLMQAVFADAGRLPAHLVAEIAALADRLGMPSARGADLILPTLLTPAFAALPGSVEQILDILFLNTETLEGELLVRAVRFVVGADLDSGKIKDLVYRLDQCGRFTELVQLDPALLPHFADSRRSR